MFDPNGFTHWAPKKEDEEFPTFEGLSSDWALIYAGTGMANLDGTFSPEALREAIEIVEHYERYWEENFTPEGLRRDTLVDAEEPGGDLYGYYAQDGDS